MKKSLILLRGLPGSGKTTLATLLSENGNYPVLSIDSYFTDGKTGEYNFDYKQNHKAYAACEEQTKQKMSDGIEKIFVDNTFVFDWEMQPYFALAKEFNYIVFSIVVEKYHENNNVHRIPQSDIEKMASKLKVKLF